MIRDWLMLNLRFLNSRIRHHGQLIYLDYPISPRPRHDFGNRRLSALFSEQRGAFADTLRSFLAYADRLKAFDRLDVSPNYHLSTYFPVLDAISLYSLIRLHKPARYIEVGSGLSTLFARAAVQDEALNTQITCIDPMPRRDIQSAADSVLFQPFEQIDLSLLDALEPNDIFFVDGSHRAFTNSDVTVAFIDCLPRLKPGVLVHFHDIFLPDDYPLGWNDRYYSEQYLLACYLLAESPWLEVILPVHYASQDPELSALLAPLALQLGGGSFWMRVKEKAAQ